MKKINVVKNVLGANDLVARSNRKIFKESNVLCVNFISSPGSGKTTLLEKTIESLLPEEKSSVIVGDLKTTRDADRLSKDATKSVQINTGMSCHLYANQIAQSIDSLPLSGSDYLFIENVGNMVCPGEFDLGENLKVVLLSLPEGDDKVAKYPTIFRAADLVLLTKIDLLHVLNFNLDRVKDDMAKINSKLRLIKVSSFLDGGVSDWISWLRKKRKNSLGSNAKFIKEE